MDGFDAVRYILDNNIEGAIVECGVGEGNFESVCITELVQRNLTRDIYMFDTFGGLTVPGVNDYTSTETPFYKMTNEEVVEEWNKHVVTDKVNNWCYCSKERVEERLNEFNYDQSKLHYVVGDVMDTLALPANIPEKIALLRLDTDWYESSKFELQKLYGNVVSGGLIIFDDYHHWMGQKKAVDEFFLEINHAPSLIQVDTVKTVSMIKP